MIERSVDGKRQSIPSGRRFSITQNGAFVRLGNENNKSPSLSRVPGGLDFTIAGDGTMSKVVFYAYDGRDGHEYTVSSERQAAQVTYYHFQLEGQTLVQNTVHDFRVAALGHPPGKITVIEKFRRVAP